MFTALQTGANAFATLSLQLLALITLQPADFGSFSMQYLAFALGASLALSLVCEPWLRRDLAHGHRGEWADYSAASGYVAAAMALVTLSFSLAVPPLREVAVLGALAVGAGVYRSCARYHAVRVSHSRHTVLGDVLSLIVVSAGWLLVALLGEHDLFSVVLIWCLSAVAAAVASQWPVGLSPRRIRRWLGTHRDEIRPLLRDSLIMDAGAIGTPYLLAPILGLQGFGVYRAVSNTAAPVRLVLTPIRPRLSATPIERQRRIGVVVVILALSLATGAAAWLALVAIGAFEIDLGSLSALVPFSVPTAVFTAANLLGSYYYIVARGHLGSRVLLTGRLVQTILAIGAPILGVVLGGLAGAIWGYAAGTAVSAVTWMALVVTRR